MTRERKPGWKDESCSSDFFGTVEIPMLNEPSLGRSPPSRLLENPDWLPASGDDSDASIGTSAAAPCSYRKMQSLRNGVCFLKSCA